jgi:hypothetical protein
MGLIIGYLGVQLFSGTETGRKVEERTEQMGRTAQRTAQETAREARSTFEGRERTAS